MKILKIASLICLLGTAVPAAADEQSPSGRTRCHAPHSTSPFALWQRAKQYISVYLSSTHNQTGQEKTKQEMKTEEREQLIKKQLQDLQCFKDSKSEKQTIEDLNMVSA